MTKRNVKAGSTVNAFDRAILRSMNQFAQHSWLVDKGIGFIAQNHLFKGGVLITLLWWAWFKSDARPSHHRERIIATLASCVAAIAVARAAALTFPFRLRPLYDAGVPFVLPYPYGETSYAVEDWSSFPSDHAVLFFTLATGLFLIRRTAGLVALFHSLVVVSAPRIYLGLHYPTDILAGALLGITIALLGNHILGQNKHIRSIVHWADARPQLFYPCLFLFTYQITDMFDASRDLVGGVVRFLRRLVA
jgi:undecaprenyl-diphosphatase